MIDDRPFYGQFGWAYDLLVDDPVEPWVDAVEAALAARALATRVRVLDAGCGTGRHAAELARRGHTLTLVDGSKALLDVARRRLPAARLLRADLETLALGAAFDVVACRGVLNDICADDDRTEVLRRFARHLTPRGIVVIDVRELAATAARYGGGRTSRREVPTPSGLLTFEASGRMDGELLRIAERHELRNAAGTRAAEYEFTMRPWTADELAGRLGEAGFREIELSAGIGRRSADRMLCVATWR